MCSRWRLTPGPVLGDRPAGTWAATRGDTPLVVKHFGEDDWRYPLRVAAALRAQGWPTPEVVEEPLVVAGGAWVLFRRLPGRSRQPSEQDRPAEQRARGRLLAQFHAAAAATGIADQRGGFAIPEEVVADPGLDSLLRRYELAHPEEGRLLRSCRAAAAEWFAANPAPAGTPRSVIHSDFVPWNLLFDGDRLTGVLDFEGTHHTYQVADFALSWRGHHDEVLRGYDEVRPLSEFEWHLILPAYWAWMFLGLQDGDGLAWQAAHLRRRSPLLAAKAGIGFDGGLRPR